MGRWEPNTEQRFLVAAIELFGEIGFERTTVAAIAQRAGLTARTFFRYFDDKREVLFKGSEQLQQTMVEALARAPLDAAPLEAIGAALATAGEFFNDERRPFARIRYAVVAANPELHERELIKMATLSGALAQALRARGVEEPDASLAAEAGIAVFRIAFAQWVSEAETRGYGEIAVESLARLRKLTAR
ncbi:TetR family transcriptional regulator [Paraburkholderia acidisoli]|uniref:TetR family transcriptional regulator n=1 Tax=Paraburkholderia acidisoli TaxID=2571748 RepID=A0A7Z2GP09_9BURK|nr:TetR family transcriptional regulator [Paraburkholderia acidisoli]QGZ65238.1 TetR family transcriptional regulator [Paraburkholderia acidisoli]